MTDVVLWAAAAVVFGAVEAATTALVSVWFAVGALAAMAVSVWTDSLVIQLAVFAVVSAAALAVMVPLLAKRRGKNAPPVTNGAPLSVGRRGVVLRAIPAEDVGRVRVDGLDWQARTADGAPLAEGARCRVEAAEGAVLVVRAVPEPEADRP